MDDETIGKALEIAFERAIRTVSAEKGLVSACDLLIEVRKQMPLGEVRKQVAEVALWGVL